MRSMKPAKNAQTFGGHTQTQTLTHWHIRYFAHLLLVNNSKCANIYERQALALCLRFIRVS